MPSGWSDSVYLEFWKRRFMLQRSNKKPLKINAPCVSKTGIDLAIRKAGQTGRKNTGRRLDATHPIQFYLILPTPDAYRRSQAPARFCLTPFAIRRPCLEPL